tara:strand:+ start:679 stop:1080 length:402 start_codon:yes stop_codon:yes gene_type:complete
MVHDKQITEFSVSNTPDGVSKNMPDGSTVFFPKSDADGKRLYTTNLKVRSIQTDCTFPKTLKATGLKSLVKSYLKDGQNLQITEGVDYILTKAPQLIESKDANMDDVLIGYYKPIVRRTVTKASDHKGLFASE